MKLTTEKNLIDSSFEVIKTATTPFGFLASVDNTDNYMRIWTRDAMMTSIALLCHQKKTLYPSVKNSLETILTNIHSDGFVPSNILLDENNPPNISYGGPVGRVDNAFWLLICGVFYMEISKDFSLKSKLRTLANEQLKISTMWEFNGKHLMYCPISSNWADEYPMEGYVLLNQILRYWAFKKVGDFFGENRFRMKSLQIKKAIAYHFFGEPNESENLFTDAQKAMLSKQRGINRIITSFRPNELSKQTDSLAFSLAIGLALGTVETTDRLIHLLQKASKRHLGLPCFFPTIQQGDQKYGSLLSNYAYSFKNKPGHFHNGGIWPMINGWAIFSLSINHKSSALCQQLTRDLNGLILKTEKHLRFSEYYDAINYEPKGTQNLCFSAAGVLLSYADQKASHLLFGRQEKKNPASFDHIALAVLNQLHEMNTETNLLFIAGESGSGKSTLAKNLQNELKKKGIAAHLMSQDNYFHLPPNQNHSKRAKSLRWVGHDEVNFEKMKKHISVFTEKSKSIIEVPVVNRLFDRFDTSEININEIDMMIIEGTYAFEIASEHDTKIFFDQPYFETASNRNLRNRDSMDEKMSEKILQIEHQIIKNYESLADLVIDKNNRVLQTNKPQV